MSLKKSEEQPSGRRRFLKYSLSLIPLAAAASTDVVSLPDFAWRLNDQQVANFIRNGWGNKAAPVTAVQVKKIRATLPPAPQK